jgi:hypothetical protein
MVEGMRAATRRKPHDRGLAKTAAMAERWIARSVRFTLPHEGYHIVRKPVPMFPANMAQLVFPPFPKTYMQFTSSDEKIRHGMFFMELTPDLLHDLLLSDMQALDVGSHGNINRPEFAAEIEAGEWMALACVVCQPRAEVVAPPTMVMLFRRGALEFGLADRMELGGFRLKVESAVFGFFKTEMEFDQDRATSFAEWMMSLVWVALDFCLTLSCSNIRQEVIQPPEKLNRKRIKNGRVPFSEFRVLDLARPPGALRDPEDYEEGPSRNSPRLHLRRCHIRHYTRTGKSVMIASQMIGKADLGTIQKTYRT